jgi:alkylated DNA repair dioxygenase AlkB
VVTVHTRRAAADEAVSLLRMIATTEEEAGPDQRAEACLINEYVMGEIPLRAERGRG